MQSSADVLLASNFWCSDTQVTEQKVVDARVTGVRNGTMCIGCPACEYNGIKDTFTVGVQTLWCFDCGHMTCPRASVRVAYMAVGV